VTDLLEKDFTDNVVQLARTMGWKIAHFRPAQTKHGWRTAMQGDKGFPDLVLAKAGRVIFAELKSGKGKLAAEQNEWLIELSGWHRKVPPEAWDMGAVLGRVEVYVWRPGDIDQIGKVLGPNDS